MTLINEIWNGFYSWFGSKVRSETQLFVAYRIDHKLSSHHGASMLAFVKRKIHKIINAEVLKMLCQSIQCCASEFDKCGLCSLPIWSKAYERVHQIYSSWQCFVVNKLSHWYELRPYVDRCKELNLTIVWNMSVFCSWKPSIVASLGSDFSFFCWTLILFQDCDWSQRHEKIHHNLIRNRGSVHTVCESKLLVVNDIVSCFMSNVHG